MACSGDSIQTSYEGTFEDVANMGTGSPIAQSFQVPADCNICAVSFYGGKGTVGTQPGTFKIEIVEGSYNGTVIATTGTLNSTDFGVWTSPAWWKVALTANVDLVAGTQYYMKMTALTGSSNDCMRWAIDTSSPSYSSGSVWSGTGSGTQSSTLDFNFRVHGTTGGATDVSFSASPLVATFSLPASTVTATQVVTVSPAVLSASFSTPAPAITGDSSVSPAPLVATFSLPTSNVITPDANVTPAVLVATFSTPAVTVTAEANAQVDSNVLSASFSIPTPTVTLGVAITVEPEVLSATFSTPTPTLTVVSNMTVSPETLVATFSLPISRTIGDFWQDKFTPASDPFVDKVYNAGDNWNDKY